MNPNDLSVPIFQIRPAGTIIPAVCTNDLAVSFPDSQKADGNRFRTVIGSNVLNLIPSEIDAEIDRSSPIAEDVERGTCGNMVPVSAVSDIVSIRQSRYRAVE